MALIDKNYNLIKIVLIALAIILYVFINRFNYSEINGRANNLRTNIITGEVSLIDYNENGFPCWKTQNEIKNK